MSIWQEGFLCKSAIYVWYLGILVTMSVIFSRTSEYALQALLYLSLQQAGLPIQQKDIADAIQVPPHFLGKILQALVKKGLVHSLKGKNGGFALGKKASEISVMQIVQAIEGDNFLCGCILGLSECLDEEPCPLHFKWKPIKQNITKLLEKRLSQFSAQFGKKLNWLDPQNRATMEQVYLAIKAPD